MSDDASDGATMDAGRLWAKRWDDATAAAPESAYLTGHLKDVHGAAGQVLAATADDQLRALRLEAEPWRQRLERVVLLAAAIHDLGKANGQFQAMIQDGGRQRLRHEWVTLLILARNGNLERWLHAKRDGREWQAVRWCVAGHHPKYGRLAPPELQDGPDEMKLLTEHEDFRASLAWIGQTFGLGPPPGVPEQTIDLTFGAADDPLTGLHDLHYDDEDDFDGEGESGEAWPPDWRRLLAAAKDTLVAADVAGSALPVEVGEVDRDTWIPITLDPTTLPTGGDYRRVADSRLGRNPPRPFQERVAAGDARVTLVRAGCGTGKTAAAYLWRSGAAPDGACSSATRQPAPPPRASATTSPTRSWRSTSAPS